MLSILWRKEMTFVMTCTDANCVIDTRLHSLSSPVKARESPNIDQLAALLHTHPAVVQGNLDKIHNNWKQEENQAQVVCPLTMTSPWLHDDKNFFHERIEKLQEDKFAMATGLIQNKLWKKLLKLVPKMKDIGCLQITACGHCFAGVPLLYAFMTTGFKCPICRFGGNAKVEIDPENTPILPAVVCVNVWRGLCLLAHVVRTRDLLEKNTGSRVVLQIARQTIANIYENMPWKVRFTMYPKRSSSSTGGAIAQVMMMKVNVMRNPMHANEGVWPEMVSMHANMRGSYSRNLSTLMRESAYFSVEIVIAADETTVHVVFCSNHVRYRRVDVSKGPHKVQHTSETIGECGLSFEKCDYFCEKVFKEIKYQVQEARLREYIMGMCGMHRAPGQVDPFSNMVGVS